MNGLGLVEFNKFNYNTVNKTYGAKSESEVLHRLGKEIELINKQTKFIKDTGHRPANPVSFEKLLDIY